MATRKEPLAEPADTDLFAAIDSDPKSRGAWIEADTARNSGRLMREARQRKGLNQAAVAKALGVSQARISQVESGKVEDMPPLEFLARYLDACGERLSLVSEPTETPRIEEAARPARRKAGILRPPRIPIPAFKAPKHVYAQVIDDSRVVLEVRKAATKSQIKEAVEKLFDVKVKTVNTLFHKRPSGARKLRETKTATLTLKTSPASDAAGGQR